MLLIFYDDLCAGDDRRPSQIRMPWILLTIIHAGCAVFRPRDSILLYKVFYVAPLPALLANVVSEHVAAWARVRAVPALSMSSWVRLLSWLRCPSEIRVAPYPVIDHGASGMG